MIIEKSIALFISYYILLTMDSDDKPMSIKDRIAKFQGIINNSPSPSPTFKPPQPKPSQPQQVTPPPTVYPPANTNNSKTQGQVESPSIVKPSAAKQQWQVNLQPAKTEAPKKNIEVPVPKAPEPKKVVEIESPDIVKPSVARQTWQPSSNSTAKNDNFLKILQNANKQVQPPTETAQQESTHSNKAAQNKQKGEENSLSTAAIRQMLEGKMANMNRQSVPVYPKTVVPKAETQIASKQAPVISTNTEVGTVKGNAQRLNQFFEAQKEQQRVKAEEEIKKQVQQAEIKPQVVNVVKKQEQTRPISQNIVTPSQPTTSPGLNIPVPGLTQHASLGSADNSELTLMARLKRKKRTKERFSSDED